MPLSPIRTFRAAAARAATAMLAGAGASIPAVARADWGFNLQSPVTPIAGEIYGLHNLILLVCFAIFVVVFGVMFYSIWAHRKSRGSKAASFHDNTRLEVVWSIIPFLILIGMAIPSTATLIRMEDTTASELSVKVTGYQWQWHYQYMDEGVGFYSRLSTPRGQIENREEKGENYLLEVDNAMVVPVDRKVRVLLTSNDVIHAWWVPALGIKKDAIPGYINSMWMTVEEPGTYRGQCAELCGKDHGFMPIVVEALPQDEFDAWLEERKAAQQTASAGSAQTASAADAGQQAAAPAAGGDGETAAGGGETQVAQAEGSGGGEMGMEELMAAGEKVYSTLCVACHGPEGQGVGQQFPPLAGSAISTGPVDAHIDIVLNGKSGTAMAPFGPQLDDTELAGVVTYERNAFGNDTGDVVQPSQVAAKR